MNPQESHLPQAVLLVIFYAIIKENVSVQHNFYRYVWPLYDILHKENIKSTN